MKRWFETWLLNVWYGNAWLGKYLLLPLTGIFCVLSALNRWLGKRRQIRHPVPVVIVGNISVGGTGKTPLVIWLVEQLRNLGFKPGVVSRGHGSKESLQDVSPDNDPATVGDEPLLIVQRTNVPLVIGRNRNQAISRLLQKHACDIVIADDGLQHYRMGRELEICVVDGQRRFGNGLCLPSGPLREPVSRLASCDFVITNGESMLMQGDVLHNLVTGEQKSLHEFAGQTVHTVTGIGNPQRFTRMLEEAGLRPRLNVYPDHHAFTGAEFQFADDLPILMTEKDAVKCRQFFTAHNNCWYLPINAVLDATLAQTLLTRLQGLRHG